LKQVPQRRTSGAAGWRDAAFLVAAHELHQLPPDQGREVVFAGRSNAGKSSALNKIVGKHGLARTSKTPGRTQQLVVFSIDATRRLVDLPGYGYAQVPIALREHWGEVLSEYFATRQSLAGAVVIMDVRHPLREYDRALLELAAANGRPCHVLLTKADKLGSGALATTLRAVKRDLAQIGPELTVQAFSAVTGDGLDPARRVIARWLDGVGPPTDATAPM
jgi:GTP-binding protein